MLCKMEAKQCELKFILVCDWMEPVLANHKSGQIPIHISWLPTLTALTSKRHVLEEDCPALQMYSGLYGFYFLHHFFWIAHGFK